MTIPSSTPYDGFVDLVLEGGGVKGIGLAGAIQRIRNRYPHVQRVAGTSAGAIVASLVAAGMTDQELCDTMHTMNFADFEDASLLARLGLPGQGLELILRGGIYRTDHLHSWIAGQLKAHGVETWGDLRYDDPVLPAEQRYKLVVVVSDLSRGRMLRLPWDYPQLCGVDPDDLPVADAVAASASIPFFFQAQHLTCGAQDGGETLTLVDGGCLSNYPIYIFDRPDCADSRWPTLGVKLSARQALAQQWEPIHDPVSQVRRLFETMADAHDNSYVDQQSFQSRTVFVDTTGVSATDFHLDDATKNTLFSNGEKAADGFLATWNWDDWRRRYCPALAPKA